MNAPAPYVLRFAAIVALLTAGSSDRAGGQTALRMSIETGKVEFFEGEPVHLLLRITNTGPDTAWMMPPDLARRSLVLTATRGDGSPVPELQVWTDSFYPLAWRGVPLAPGATWFEPAVLQDFLGDDGTAATPIYNRHLRQGALRVVARYNPSVSEDAASVVVEASQELVVRPRTPAEDASYREVERVRALAWDPATRGRYAAALLDFAARRQAADSADPFLPFLLNEGVATFVAVGARIDAPTGERLQRMRLGAARVLRNTPAGAMAAVSALGGRRVDSAAVSQLLGPSLSGEVVRERQTRVRAPKVN